MPLSEEDLAQVKEATQTMINGVVANLKKMGDLQRDKDSKAFAENVTKLLDEKLQAWKPPTPVDDPPKDGKDGKRSQRDELEAATTRKQLADLQKRIDESERRESEARAKVEANELQTRVGRTLSTVGIEGRRFALAYPVIKERIRRQGGEPDGPWVFVEDSGEEVEVETGVTGWSKSEDAKVYMPPSGAAGSGARRAASPLSKTDKKDTTYEDVGNFVLGLTAPMGARLGE